MSANPDIQHNHNSTFFSNVARAKLARLSGGHLYIYLALVRLQGSFRNDLTTLTDNKLVRTYVRGYTMP